MLTFDPGQDQAEMDDAILRFGFDAHLEAEGATFYWRWGVKGLTQLDSLSRISSTATMQWPPAVRKYYRLLKAKADVATENSVGAATEPAVPT